VAADALLPVIVCRLWSKTNTHFARYLCNYLSDRLTVVI